MSGFVRDILRRYADIDRPILRGKVVDISRYAETGTAYIGVSVLGRTVQAVYRDGRPPRVNEFVQVIRMSKDSNLYYAFPLTVILILRRVFPFVVPAFDNTWYKAEYLGKGISATHPDDDDYAVVLGRRNDNTWEIRSNYPHSPARYALQSGGQLRDTMRVHFELSISLGGGGPRLANNRHLTYAFPDDGSDPGLTPNAYVSHDDGATWFDWTFMNGLVDVNEFYQLTGWLKNGGTQFGWYITNPGGSVELGGTFQTLTITGRHWKFGYAKQWEEVLGSNPIRVRENIAFLGPAGMTVFEYEHFSGQGGPRTVPLFTWTYTPPVVTDCPWEGRAWLVSNVGVDDEVWWLPGHNRDRSPVPIYKTATAALRGGTPVWSIAVDTATPFPLDPTRFDDVVLADRNVKFIPNLSINGNAFNLWPIHNLLLFATVIGPYDLVTGTEAAFTPPGAVEGAYPPRLRWINTEGFEQFRETVDDDFVFKLMNYAWTGSDPGAGAQFDGDGVNGSQLIPGGRLYGVYQDFDSVVKVVDSTGTLIEDTSTHGQEYAFWGDYAYSQDGAIDRAGIGSRWWDMLGDDE